MRPQQHLERCSASHVYGGEGDDKVESNEGTFNVGAGNDSVTINTGTISNVEQIG